ncbi:FAD-dependent oxidoreductase [Clostridiales bacterium PH28_bin88]|nr:FAD-dependent oxidoreductase [Clostridiales bacterium PH28_bin88]
MTAAETVIIGGGAIGTSIAYYLARQGREVLLVERADLAAGSSGACDKAVILQSKNPGLHLQLALKSAAIYPALGDELGADLEYSRDGGMIVIETEEELAVMRDFVRRQQEIGLSVDLLDREEALTRQPALSRHIVGATHSAMDAEVNPINLTLAFARAARRLGARIALGTNVTGILTEQGRVTGVVTDRGEIRARQVVNCAGAYAPEVGRMVGLEIPIKPRRGQILVSEPVPKLIHGDILSAKYIVAKHNPALVARATGKAARMGVGLSLGQTHSGNLLIGATREFVGYDRGTTYGALTAIATNAVRLVPAIKHINLIRTFAGLRPYTPDGLPILGPVPEIKGFYMAAGHEGDGVALAPVTGMLMAECLAAGQVPETLRPFSITRFQTRQEAS